MNHKLLLIVLLALTGASVNGLVEDIIDVLHLTREVVKSVAGAWEIVEQTQVANEIDLPFLKRKEKKIILRMAELSNEIKASEMMVSNIIFCSFIGG